MHMSLTVNCEVYTRNLGLLDSVSMEWCDIVRLKFGFGIVRASNVGTNDAFLRCNSDKVSISCVELSMGSGAS